VKRANKHNARRVGASDSKLEDDFRQHLALLKAAGKIEEFTHHPGPVVFLHETSRSILCEYEPDFEVVLNSFESVTFETKGMRSRGPAEQLWRLKMRMFVARFPDHAIYLVRQDRNGAWVYYDARKATAYKARAFSRDKRVPDPFA
jgi:hypothetical protein